MIVRVRVRQEFGPVRLLRNIDIAIEPVQRLVKYDRIHLHVKILELIAQIIKTLSAVMVRGVGDNQQSLLEILPVAKLFGRQEKSVVERTRLALLRDREMPC